MSSSQLTKSYFSEGWLNQQPDFISYPKFANELARKVSRIDTEMLIGHAWSVGKPPWQVITYMMGLLGPEWTEVVHSKMSRPCWPLVSGVSGLWSTIICPGTRFERNHLQWNLNKVQAGCTWTIQQRTASCTQTALGSKYGCVPPHAMWLEFAQSGSLFNSGRPGHPGPRTIVWMMEEIVKGQAGQLSQGALRWSMIKSKGKGRWVCQSLPWTDDSHLQFAFVARDLGKCWRFQFTSFYPTCSSVLFGISSHDALSLGG